MGAAFVGQPKHRNATSPLSLRSEVSAVRGTKSIVRKRVPVFSHRTMRFQRLASSCEATLFLGYSKFTRLVRACSPISRRSLRNRSACVILNRIRAKPSRSQVVAIPSRRDRRAPQSFQKRESGGDSATGLIKLSCSSALAGALRTRTRLRGVITFRRCAKFWCDAEEKFFASVCAGRKHCDQNVTVEKFLRNHCPHIRVAVDSTF
jgi:hypothetical protein